MVRAIGHLSDLIEEGGCRGTTPSGAEFACVVDRGQSRAELGSTALAVVALVEYERATGEKTFAPLAAAMTEWILFMQRDDGSFAHVYDVKSQTVDHKTELFYYTGEAALALARMHEVTGEARYRDAAEAALDWLVGWYDFFIGGFFYGEEHWTCIAAEAAWPAVQKKSYETFCRGYGDFLRRQQVVRGDFPDLDDLEGTYTFTPFVSPPNTPAGSRTEAMVSAYLLSTYHGDPDQAIRRQIALAARFTLRQQVTEEGLFWVPERARGLGAVPESPVRASARIDYVQHLCSGMIRAAEVLENGSPVD